MTGMDDGERRARLALSCVVEAGDLRISAMVAEYGAVEVWQALRNGSTESRWSRRARDFGPRRIELVARSAGARFLIPGDPEWPSRVDGLATAGPVQNMGGVPLGLWVRGSGDLLALTRRAVALVGARSASAYGEQVATELAAELSEAGWVTVSGGALGIDAAAHRGALAAEGRTVVVLAGGPDNPYPTANQPLFKRVMDGGVLVSEQPPGEPPTRPRFLARNRMIAALSGGVVVVQASARSGARNTASWAGRCGVPVMAVPGSVHSDLSVTPHNLIRDHEAVLVTNAAHVRDVIGGFGQDSLPLERGPERPLDHLDDDAKSVYEAIPARSGRSADDLSIRTGVPIGRCLAALATLQLAGYVRPDGRGQWGLG